MPHQFLAGRGHCRARRIFGGLGNLVGRGAHGRLRHILLVPEEIQRRLQVSFIDRQAPGRNILGVAHVGKLIRRQRFAVYRLRECIGHAPNLSGVDVIQCDNWNNWNNWNIYTAVSV